jgi:hypothetical protein
MQPFDINQNVFPSKEHNAVWNLGIHIMPLDVTLPPEMRASLPPYMVKSCEDMYGFMLHFLRDMYDNIELYLPLPYQLSRKMVIPFMTLATIGEAGEGTLTIPRAAYDKLIKSLRTKLDYEDDRKAGIPIEYRIGMWSRVGLKIEYSDTDVILTNELYPDMFYALCTMAAASADEKASMDNSFTYCNFRKLNTAYKYDKYENALIFLNDEQRALARELDATAKKYKLTRSIPSGHCAGYGIVYSFKKIPVLSLNCLSSYTTAKALGDSNNYKSTDMAVRMKLLYDEQNPALIDGFFAALERDSDELKRFVYTRLGRCRVCYPHCRTYRGTPVRIYGKPNKICFRDDRGRLKGLSLGNSFMSYEAPMIEKVLPHLLEHTAMIMKSPVGKEK